MFFKTASTPILGVYQTSGKFTKKASQNCDISSSDDSVINKSLNLISPDIIKTVSKLYNISSNIDDYIFPVPRAVGADEPNSNGDRFTHDELTRYSSNHKCLVYQTFRNDPLHIEHASENPKTARGFLPDAYYVSDNPKDKYVLTICAVDTKKDPDLAEGLLSGDIKYFSMGCMCEAVKCSICNKVANSDKEMCDHLKYKKMQYIGGKLVFEDCLGVEFQELSVVGDPAYAKAATQYILNKSANKRNKMAQFNDGSLISSILSPEDQVEIAKFFIQNKNNLPISMLRLANKLF